MGIMEKSMEATIMGLDRVEGSGGLGFLAFRG